MKTFNVLLPVLFLAGSTNFDPAAVRTNGVVIIGEIPVSDYCHLGFPEIREDTLFDDRPVLEESKTSARIDFYAHCAHKPIGTEEIQTQREEFNEDFDSTEDGD